MTKNMTEGKPMQLLLRFALPLVLGDLFQQTYNIVDAAIVGRTLGAAALASVGTSSSVQFLVLGFCIGISQGFGIPVAQSFGAGRLSEMRKNIFHSILLTAIFAVLLTGLCSVFCMQILALLKTPEEIRPDAWRYLVIIFLGIPCTLLYNVCSSILRAVGDSKTPFYFLVFSAILNVFLDFFCILSLRMGVAGASFATVVSQGISGVLCVLLIRKKYTVLHLSREDCHPEKRTAWCLIGMAVPMGLQYSITAIGSMVMQSANNSLGTVYVSAFAAGSKLKQFTLSPFQDIAASVATFVGQNHGAGKYRRVREGIRSGLRISVLYGVLIGIVLIFFGRDMSLLFISGDHVRELDASGQYLRCMGYFYWLLAFLNVARMTIQAIGFPGYAMYAGVLEMIARSAVSLLLTPVLGFTAICFTDQVAWVAAVLYLMPLMEHCIKKAESGGQRLAPDA